MEIPQQVREMLEHQLETEGRPFCMLVDAEYRVVDCWGDRAAYGLEAITNGQDAVEVAPFLAGQPLGQTLGLPFVTDADGRAFHIDLIPDGDSCFVLFLDAEQECRRTRQVQQIANESRLIVARQKRLIDELIDTKTELALRRREAEEQSRDRGRYMAMMSHEFRTPLTAALGYVDLVTECDDLPVAAREHAVRLKRVTQQQLVLVDNLLNQARLEVGGVAIREVLADIRGLVEDISVLIAPLAAEKGLAFSAQVARRVPEYLRLDEIRFRQIVVNIMGNAVKYCEEGTVRLVLDWQDAGLEVRIDDTGPGIAAEQLPTLFRPFQRGASEPHAPGAGLGLSISRQLAEAMGGTITLRSRLTEGTTVTITLPAASATESPGGDPRANADLETGKILIAEDDPDLRLLLTAWLEQDGQTVTAAADGEEALAQTLKERPDLLVVDTNMPRLGGPGVARSLRARGFDGAIVALSGAHDPRDVEFALSCGCDEFLAKPPHRGTFLRVVRRMLLGTRLCVDARPGDLVAGDRAMPGDPDRR